MPALVAIIAEEIYPGPSVKTREQMIEDIRARIDGLPSREHVPHGTGSNDTSSTRG